MKQTTLPSSWNPEAEEYSSSDSSSSKEKVKQSRALPLQWTRVKSLEMIKSQRVMVYKAAEDLKFDKSLKTIRKEMDQSRGEFVFDPEDFKEVAFKVKIKICKMHSHNKNNHIFRSIHHQL